MSRVIEAKAVISGEDRLSGVIDKVNAKLKQVGKGAKISAEIDRMNQSLANTNKQLAAIDKVRSAQGRLAGATLGLSGAQTRAEQVAAKLEAARKADDKAATAALVAEQRQAQRAVLSATRAVERQGEAVRAAKQEVASFGVPIRDLGAHEVALKASVDKTTLAIERETAAMKRREEIAHAEARRQAAVGLPVPAALQRDRRGKGKEKGDDDGLGLGALTGAGLVGRLGMGPIGLVGGALAVRMGLRKAFDEAVSFERAMIEVGKATDTQGGELDAYGERLLKLSRDTGKTKEDLASMLSSAGFAGRPKDELMDFTEYASKATVAWQTGAEETGQALAELGNIYGANQKRIEGIGDAINTMADNSASKETDLLEFLRRAGASGKTAGIAAEQMLAFGAAMKEVGVRNEVAGTGMEALLNVMKLGEEFSKSAAKGLKALGVDSDKMRKAFVAKPVETMVDLLEKLNQVADPLKKAEIMTNLFGKEYQDDMAKLLNALPQINKYLGIMGDKAQIAKGGVRFQFAQNLDKDVMKIDRANAAIDALMTRLGTPLKMLGGDYAEQINQAVERLENGDSPVARLLKRLESQDKDKKPDEAKPSGPTPVYDPIARYTTKTLGLLDPEMARAAAANDLAIAEAARVESVKKVAALEKEIAETRERTINRGGTEAQADAGVKNKRAELKLAKRAQADAEKAEAEARNAVAALDTKPLRMGVHPLDPIQGKPGAIKPGAKSWLEAFPLEFRRDVPLPPTRPDSIPRGSGRRSIDSIDDPLGPSSGRGQGGWSGPFGGKAHSGDTSGGPRWSQQFGGDLATLDKRSAPDQRLEATVKPDQIRAAVEQPVPVNVTGSVTETVQHQHQHTISLNTDMVDARIRSVATQTVRSIPLSTGGARPGAVSMLGAAGTPGGKTAVG